jgi:tRNA(fMet)-specific endonuclease VapC
VSLYVLDTDILSHFQRGHAVVCRHVTAHALTDLAVTVITVEEQVSGWYALLRTTTRRDELALAYQSLAESIPFLAKFRVLSFSEMAMDEFDRLVAMKLNVRKMDLRIASIALEHGATVATGNIRDFQRVPGLRVEDWIV